jgi:hypothetical protein
LPTLRSDAILVCVVIYKRNAARLVRRNLETDHAEL